MRVGITYAISNRIQRRSATLGRLRRRTWELVEELNRSLGTPVVETAAGGSRGGGAVLTRAGKAVIERYRAIEMDTGWQPANICWRLTSRAPTSSPPPQKETAS
jgi:molybdate transport system regulatory protein